jgi:hypothetical protein
MLCSNFAICITRNMILHRTLKIWSCSLIAEAEYNLKFCSLL